MKLVTIPTLSMMLLGRLLRVLRRLKAPAVAVCVIAAGWSASVAHARPNYAKTPAGISDASRDASTYDDFMRLLWVDPKTPVNYLGRHDKVVTNLRAFFTATTFIKPAVTVDQLVALVGNSWQDGKDLVLMRCQPSSDQEQNVNPVLATWPNVFTAIVSDFQGEGFSCPPDPSDGNNVMFCAAQAYVQFCAENKDCQQSVFVTGLFDTFESAMQITDSSPGAKKLKDNYGIYPAFTGLGYAAAGSGMVPTMNTTEVLRGSIVPEYLLENVLLTDAGCRCIQVPQYGNAENPDIRHTKPVDPNYVWRKGNLDNGSCRVISRLGTLTPDP